MPAASAQGTTRTPTPDNQNYQIWPWFTGTDGECADSLYLLPPVFNYRASYGWTASLLFNDGGDLSKGVTNDDFELTLTGPGGGHRPTQDNVTANLTITGKNMWACAPGARSALMGNFASFIAAVESELELVGTLVSGATSVIARQVSDRMAAPLLETLFYRYRFSAGRVTGTTPYVDLSPGMRLRIDTGIRQFVTPSSSLNEYIAAGGLPVQVGSVPGEAGRTTAFDPLLGTIRAPTVDGAPSVPVQASGLVDLSPVAGARRHWRLLYPASVVAPGDPGDVTAAKNVTLLGADTLTALDAATVAWPKAPDPPAVTAIFLGRALLLPQIPVWVANATRGVTALDYMSVGTTLANVVERFGPIPIDPSTNTLTATRTSTASTQGGAGGLNFPSELTALSSRLFDVPLIAGDVLSFSA